MTSVSKERKLLVLSRRVEETHIDTGNSIIRALTADRSVSYLDYEEIYLRHGFRGAHDFLQSFVEKNRINTLIYSSSPAEFHFDVTFMEELRKDVFMVMMTGDTEMWYEARDQYLAQAMDLVIVGDFTSPCKFREIGVEALPFFGYYDGAACRRYENAHRSVDVSFIGPLEDKMGRRAHVDFLRKNGVDVEVYGDGTAGGFVSNEKKEEIFNSSKINLNFSGVSERTRLTRKHTISRRKKQIKGRVLEVAFCGGFVLTEYAPGIENVFEIGKEIETFVTDEEMLEKVRYYLAHDGERERIAAGGHERATREYSTASAVPRLLGSIDERRDRKTYRPSPVYIDEVYRKNFATFRFLMMIRHLKRAKFGYALEEFRMIARSRRLDLYQVRVFLVEEILDGFPGVKRLLKALWGGSGGRH